MLYYKTNVLLAVELEPSSAPMVYHVFLAIKLANLAYKPLTRVLNANQLLVSINQIQHALLNVLLPVKDMIQNQLIWIYPVVNA